MANEPMGVPDLHGATAAYRAGPAMPFDWLAGCWDARADALDHAWAWIVAPRGRRPVSRVLAFAVQLIKAASVAHDEARPVLDAEASERFRRLVLPQLDAAYSFARFLSRDADAAHDIVQDAFLKACRHFGSFRDGNVRAWLFAIVRNCHHDWHAARARTARYVADPDAADDDDFEGGSALDRVVSEEDTPEAALIRKTEAGRVRGVLLGLPRALREVLVLRELENLSYREIAAVTALPIGTVMSRLARARGAFAAAWTEDSGIGRARP
ncbi:sigma-70 family RNA polymerase sigma factor [Methylobacterium sp. J-070]|uniref:sigma-70 family RNA polymerase sigma factor n=1 Tax=Methylobacterium sp. J-070 TaxID=2836650 RepID=UPI001FB93F2F|nr:sigma-70 family RNA polymerase sigma factor [Methylobacterium sp. J-070]MCJ2050340.1 sigma-70 family RNA polymerase sigma factor [Methylobacterium sp. J-070]